MSSDPRIDYILCEGYDDRSFWKGLLQRLGWDSIEPRPGSPVRDLTSRPVTEGKYLFRKAGNRDVILQPVRGREKTKREALLLIGKDDRPTLGKLILNLDSDEESSAGSISAFDQVRNIVQAAGGQANGISGPHQVGDVLVYPVVWQTAEESPQAGVPTKETLEKVIATAICRAYPERGAAVQEWLEKAPLGEVVNGKSYGYSYYAKWYTKHGEDFFYRAPWEDEKVAGEIVEILKATPAWDSILAFDAD